jgi:hypothetical protein
MIPNMITLRSENQKIVNAIIVLVAVLMVYDLTRKKRMVLADDIPGDPRPLPMDDKRIPVAMFKPSEVAALRTEYMFLLAYLAPRLRKSLPAACTGDGDVCGGLACIHSGLPQDLKYSLPCDSVLLGKCDHGDKPISVGINYVNSLGIRQSALCSHPFTSIFDGLNIHSDSLVVKGKCGHKVYYETCSGEAWPKWSGIVQ